MEGAMHDLYTTGSASMVKGKHEVTNKKIVNFANVLLLGQHASQQQHNDAFTMLTTKLLVLNYTSQ